MRPEHYETRPPKSDAELAATVDLIGRELGFGEEEFRRMVRSGCPYEIWYLRKRAERRQEKARPGRPGRQECSRSAS